MSETKKTLTVKLYGNLGRDPELRSTREQVYHPPAQASTFLGTATLPPTLARSILLQDGHLPHHLADAIAPSRAPASA